MVIRIVWFFFVSLHGTYIMRFHPGYVDSVVVFVLLAALCTKSAIYPFSPWLPAAISAPTPISSLVHSSTLVTAGLYLIIRYSFLLYAYPTILSGFLFICLFTSFFAGINSCVEVDLKKLVALSTLSHLGFIGVAFASGWELLAVFHLFTHALFKSLLFMSVGDVIRVESHYQDARVLSAGLKITPISYSYILVSVFSLLGVPFLRGFYSKDMVLEALCYNYGLRVICSVVLYLNLLFTFVYSLRVVLFSASVVRLRPYRVIRTRN